MGIARRTLQDNAVGPEKLTAGQRQGRYCLETFMGQPLIWETGTASWPAGTDAVTYALFTGRYIFEYYKIGAATTVVAPTLGTDGGYNWATQGDIVLDMGVEVNFGGGIAGHPRSYKVGTDEAFARILLNVDDTSAVDLFFGFRKIEAYQAALTSYGDFCGFRSLGDDSSALSAVTRYSNQSSTGATTLTIPTDLFSSTVSVPNWTDATNLELEVRLVGTKVQLYANGVFIDYGPAYNFTAGDWIVPVMHLQSTTDASSDVVAAVKSFAFECGLLADRPSVTLASLAQGS